MMPSLCDFGFILVLLENGNSRGSQVAGSVKSKGHLSAARRFESCACNEIFIVCCFSIFIYV